jgi:hypothetical protein
METGHVVQQDPIHAYGLMPPFGPTPKEVTAILSEGTLERLRRVYKQAPSRVAEASLQSIVGMYSPSAAILKEVKSGFFTDPKFARDREQLVITMLAVRMGNRRMHLALHFYWGMMEGLSPEDIAHRLLFVGFYSGIETLTSSLETLGVVLLELKKHTEEAESDDALAPQAIMLMLRNLFP